MQSKQKIRKKQERLLAGLSHLFPILAGLIYEFSSKESEFVRKNILNSLSWNMTMLFFLFIPIMFSPVLILPLMLISITFSTIAIEKSLNGNVYKYPISLLPQSKEEKEIETRVDRMKKMYVDSYIDEKELEERVENHIKSEENEKINREKVREK